jgi:glycosyltransferase involved in cell wall biosynthesis
MTIEFKAVVYVALGEFRIKAAREHTAAFAARGAKVTLVTADRPEWTGVEAPPGVTLRRVGDKAWPAVRPLLTGADLLVAGDPAAMPIAERARRAFPGLTVRTDPSGDPDRRPAPADLAVVTPWYPSPNDAFAGAFVRAAVEAVGGRAGTVSILHTDHWFYPPWRLAGNLIDITLERELARSGGVTVHDVAEGELARVVAPQPRKQPYAVWADEQVRRLRAALPTGRIEAPLIHAHTGHFGGVMAAELARPDARIVVTEHATFLAEVFRQPASRRQYAAMLARVDALLCVSGYLRDQIAAEFPQHAAKLRVVPNPIDFSRFAVRPAPPQWPRRWLYAGRMLDHKGVRTLLDAFALIAAEDPDVTLTLVGSGRLEDDLRARIGELGLIGRVEQRPAVAPEAMTGLLHEHDLLVHASEVETFGMTVVEAVATGTPVLVAASQGPTETLAGLDGVAGRLFPVTRDPEVLAAAYRELRERWAELDPAGARERLRERYGFDATGELLLNIYRQPSPATVNTTSIGEPAGRIVVISIRPPRVARTRDFVRQARERGFGVDLIVEDPDEWAAEAADPGIRVHGIRPQPGRRPAQVSGSPMAAAVARTLEGKARSLRRKVTRVPAALFRPHTMWRDTRIVLPRIDMTKVRQVVVNGVLAERIGWQIARRNPGLTVTLALKLPDGERS